MAQAGINIETETKILALIARGDMYQSIQDATGVSKVTIGDIKKRNKANLDIIKQKMFDKQLQDAMVIKQKANGKISRRLDMDDKNLEVLEKAQADYIAGDIDSKEFLAITRRVKELSIGELVVVSKEMHHQSAADDDPKDSPADIAALVAAIKSGDETKVTQVIFNGSH